MAHVVDGIQSAVSPAVTPADVNVLA